MSIWNNHGRWLSGLLLTAVILTGCTTQPPAEKSGDSAQLGDETSQSSSQSQGDTSSQSGEDQSTQSPDGSQQDTGTEEQPAAAYDFSKPCPESEAVDNSYFEDAAFIGDSRTDGFLIYSGIGCGENLTSNGLSIFKLGTKKALTIDG